MLIDVTMTEIISNALSRTADESRPAEAALDNLRTHMPAITYGQDSEIDMNEGSFDTVRSLLGSHGGRAPLFWITLNSLFCLEHCLTTRLQTIVLRNLDF